MRLGKARRCQNLYRRLVVQAIAEQGEQRLAVFAALFLVFGPKHLLELRLHVGAMSLELRGVSAPVREPHAGGKYQALVLVAGQHVTLPVSELLKTVFGVSQELVG